MANSIKKRGQKIIRKFSRVSARASEEGKEHIKENLIQRISHIRHIRLLIVEWILLIVALFMMGVAQAIWSENTYSSEAFVGGGTYIEAAVGRVNSMNPLFAATSSEKILSRLMFGTLTSVDYSGHVGPELAESVVASDGGKTWTVKLKDNLYWSDGEPITNADVIFTTELIKNPATNTVYNANLEGVKVSENDNGEIVFRLPAAYVDFISALDFPIVPQHILADVPAKTLVEAPFSNSPVTSGPFSFNAVQSTTSDGEGVYYLSANPRYYLGKPMVNSFAVHAYPTEEGVINAVNAGLVTATAELSGTDLEKITTSAFEVRRTNISSGIFAFFNVSNASLTNVELRRAIRQGINTTTIREKANGANALDYPLSKNQISLSHYPALPGYDLAAAKSKIAELVGSEKPRLNVTTVDDGYLPVVAENLAEQLRELGFESEVVVYPENQDFVANVVSRRNYAILLYDIELGADPDLLPYYHSSQASTAGLNLSNYRNSLVDDLLIGARETLDENLRAKKYESFLEYWVSDVPAIGLYQSDLTYIYNKNVRPYSEKIVLVDELDRFSDITGWAVAHGMLNKTP